MKCALYLTCNELLFIYMYVVSGGVLGYSSRIQQTQTVLLHSTCALCTYNTEDLPFSTIILPALEDGNLETPRTVTPEGDQITLICIPSWLGSRHCHQATGVL